jgi:V8-like Glu-specific endopeptidase
MTKSKAKSIGVLCLILFQFSLCFAQRDSVLVCDVAFKDSAFNNPHAGSGFILKQKDKLYGITAKHVLFFAKTDSMKTISFDKQLKSWEFKSKQNDKVSVLAGKLINEDPNEAIEMPPKGDWLIFEIESNIGQNIAVYEVREKPLTIGEKVRFFGYPYKNEQAVSVQGSFIGFTTENNLKLDVSKGNYGGCSGGPVLDANDKLVGIVSMGYFNQKEQKMIFELASLDYFKQIIT